MPPLKSTILQYLSNNPTDEEVIHLFKKVRILQTNGIQIKKAIATACESHGSYKIKIEVKNYHKDNSVSYLAIRYRAKISQYRSEGFGYGTIAKLLAQRGCYDPITRKAFSRSTIQRACNTLLKKG